MWSAICQHDFISRRAVDGRSASSNDRACWRRSRSPANNPANNPAHNGFTLVEAVVTLAVAAILITVAIPSFRNIIQNNRATSLTNRLVTSINLTRSEAVRRQMPVAICPSADPQATPPSCAATTDWSTGWIVFTDTEAGTLASFDSGTDVVLRRGSPLSDGASLTSGGADAVRYMPSGLVDDPANAPFDFTLALPDCSGNSQRNLEISPTGQVSVTRAQCS